MIDRFLAKVSPEPNSGCWLWTAAGDEHGYGHFGIGHAKCEKAHRFSYRALKGEIPAGLIVCHKCDVPSCVNPDHLFLGTPRVNSEDRDRKGRSATGTRNGKARLSPDDVFLIRESDLSERKIAAFLRVHRGTVNAVRSGRTWSHLKEGNV